MEQKCRRQSWGYCPDMSTCPMSFDCSSSPIVAADAGVDADMSAATVACDDAHPANVKPREGYGAGKLADQEDHFEVLKASGCEVRVLAQGCSKCKQLMSLSPRLTGVILLHDGH